MPSLSLGTLKSSPDEKGNCHRLSIDALSSKSHEFVTTYKARIFSFNSDRDPRDRELAHVRFPATQGVCTDAWAECELEKSELARKLATKFNEYVRQMTRIKPDISDLEATRISFLKSQMATLDSISFVHRKRKKGDCLVFQEVLEDVFHFIGSTGDADSANQSRQGQRSTSSRSKSASTSQGLRTRSRHIPIPAAHRDRSASLVRIGENRRSCASSVESVTPPSYEESLIIELRRASDLYPPIELVLRTPLSYDYEYELVEDNVSTGCDESDLANPLLQTFVHFSFCHTRGQAVICGLKGTISNDQYKLVTPVIHSLGRHFGEKDGGKRAMRKVLDNHRCSALCRHLPTHFNVLEHSPNFNWDYV